MRPGRRPTLVLWDVDRTLVDIGDVSREIYAAAFEDVTGVLLREIADMPGRTEQAILVETLALHGITTPVEGLEVFYEALAAASDRLRHRMRAGGRRLPGSREAMAALDEHGAVQSVVTGNIKPIAIAKLQTFELAEHVDFEVGGYGSDDGTRVALVRLARERAERKYRTTFQDDRVVIIGDTPHDIEGARLAGVRAVGVATGSSGIDELEQAAADVVLSNLRDRRAVANAVLGGGVPL